MELTINLLKLHPLQQAIKDHPARFKVVACGRRVGKTEYAKDELIDSGLETPLPMAYFAPTYKMLRDVWDGMKAMAYPVVKNVNEQEKRLEIITGAVIDCWSLDNPDGARGRKYKKVVIDEAAMIPKLEYAWNEVIRPTLTDYEGGATFLSTPKGRNFFWQLFNRGNDPLYPEWMSWQQPTAANPYILPSEIDAAQNELPERSFRQEYLAEFLEDAGSVFRGVAEIATLLVQEPITGHSYVMGVDWAKSEDFTCLVVFDETANQVATLDRFNQVSWALQRGRLISLFEQYRPRLIVAESNSIGEPNIEALEAERLPIEGFQTTISTKAPLIDALALAIERKTIGLLAKDAHKDAAVMIHELQSYEMTRLPSGTFRYSAPEGGHDDTVIALALAWHAANVRPAIGRARKIYEW